MSHVLRHAGLVIGRSLFPFATLAVVWGTLLWGPWVSLGLVFGLWRMVTWKA